MVSYERVLKRNSLQRATHIFTDIDRLASWQVQEAAVLYRKLRLAGIPALNDPALFLGRFGLLRGLCHARINQFNAYRVDSFERPSKWPVFLRLEGNHGAPVSGLLENEDELEDAVKRAIDDGSPRSSLLIIEYAAEPVQPGIYRKLSVFRIGQRMLGYTCVHDDNWLVKYGKLGITTPELYQEEYTLVADNPYGAAVKPAFELAGIEYGRIDFGLVGGRPQIYEINSNPHIELRPKPALSDIRNQSVALFRTRYIDAMAAIDSHRRPAWRVKSSSTARIVRSLPARIMGKLAQAAAGRPADTARSAELASPL